MFVVVVGGAPPGLVAVELLPLPLVVAVVVAEPPAAGAPGSVPACWATSAEFKRGFRVDVPVGGKREGEKVI